jgi:Pvc16 N-terminal domain
MIQKALQFINDNLNDFLKNKMALKENIVILNNIANINGTVPLQNQNKIVLTLFNLSEEQIIQSRFPISPNSINQTRKRNCSFHLLLSSYFDNYAEALKLLDAAHKYFYENAVFNAISFSNFPAGLENVQISLHSTTAEELHHIWASVGAKYLPSLIYKVRVLHSDVA